MATALVTIHWLPRSARPLALYGQLLQSAARQPAAWGASSGPHHEAGEGAELGVHAVCQLDDLELNTGRRFTVDGREIGVFRLDDGVYALRDRCTHGNGRLSEGYVEQGLVECPLHAGCFDIRTGRAARAPVTINARSYRVTVESGAVYVELPDLK